MIVEREVADTRLAAELGREQLLVGVLGTEIMGGGQSIIGAESRRVIGSRIAGIGVDLAGREIGLAQRRLVHPALELVAAIGGVRIEIEILSLPVEVQRATQPLDPIAEDVPLHAARRDIVQIVADHAGDLVVVLLPVSLHRGRFTQRVLQAVIDRRIDTEIAETLRRFDLRRAAPRILPACRGAACDLALRADLHVAGRQVEGRSSAQVDHARDRVAIEIRGRRLVHARFGDGEGRQQVHRDGAGARIGLREAHAVEHIGIIGSIEPADRQILRLARRRRIARLVHGRIDARQARQQVRQILLRLRAQFLARDDRNERRTADLRVLRVLNGVTAAVDHDVVVLLLDPVLVLVPAPVLIRCRDGVGRLDRLRADRCCPGRASGEQRHRRAGQKIQRAKMCRRDGHHCLPPKKLDRQRHLARRRRPARGGQLRIDDKMTVSINF